MPNLFTLANLFFGFWAIVSISKNDFFLAAIMVLAAGVFDALDGVMARLIKSTSEFGAELDSLCDAVSFGIVPSYMLYKVYFYQFNELGVLFAALPALTGVLRLARFNIQVTGFEDKSYFRGMPIPSSAIIIISYIVFYHQANFLSDELKAILIFAVTFLTSLAMISTVKYDNLPRPTKKSFMQRPTIAIFFVIAVIGSLVSKGLLIFPFMMLYLIVSAIKHFVLWLLRKKNNID